MALKTTQDRRRTSRVNLPGRVEIDVLHREARVAANSVNLSENGMCLRLQEALEIRSRVMLRLFPEPSRKPVECRGQVAWVVQRLDLRDVPPFLYDVGVEFVDPPLRLRQFASRAGVLLKSGGARILKDALVQPATIRGRWYVPHLEQESSAGGRWHLVVSLEGMPCFSRRYPSEREAVKSWERFKRKVAKPIAREVRS